jgi:hypothetical protein
METRSHFFFVGSRRVAVLTSQPFTLWREGAEQPIADSIPPVEFTLVTGDDPPGEFFGEICSPTPRFVGGVRQLTEGELACDGLIVTGAGQPMIDALRAAGFRGAIFAPGKVGPRPDGAKGMTALLRAKDGLYCMSPALA